MEKYYFRKILSSPKIYNLYNILIGEKNFRRIFVDDYIKPQKGAKILDIGCGTGEMLEYFVDVEYDGYDASSSYIDQAKKKFGNKGNFFCDYIETNTLNKKEYYDIVIASGLIHHLGNESVKKLLSTAKDALRIGGHFVSIDNILTENQSKVAKYLILKDRGEYIRHDKEYKSLFETTFKNTKFDIRTDLLRIPYSHIIAVSEKE